MIPLLPISLSECLREFRSQLASVYDRGEMEYVLSAVFEKIVGLSKAEISSGKDLHVSEALHQQLMEMLARLRTHEPLQYVLGEAWFFGMKLTVNKNVLIPRPETEELTEWVIDELRSFAGHPRILDACTGSGCIALALKNKFPAARVTGTDNSPAALAVAQKNAEGLGLDIQFSLDDMLHPQSPASAGPFDFIVSNPPYIGEDERPDMARRVKDFEPPAALFTGTGDPLLFYRALSAFAAQQLDPSGSLYFEINSLYGREVCELLFQKDFKGIELKKDLSGMARHVKAKSPKFEA